MYKWDLKFNYRYIRKIMSFLLILKSQVSWDNCLDLVKHLYSILETFDHQVEQHQWQSFLASTLVSTSCNTMYINFKLFTYKEFNFSTPRTLFTSQQQYNLIFLYLQHVHNLNKNNTFFIEKYYQKQNKSVVQIILQEISCYYHPQKDLHR